MHISCVHLWGNMSVIKKINGFMAYCSRTLGQVGDTFSLISILYRDNIFRSELFASSTYFL